MTAEGEPLRVDGCVVLLLGPPAAGKRTVGGHLARLLGGVLVDNALINRPLLELLQWDGVAPLPAGFWGRVVPIREAVLSTIEELGPPTTSYVFTNVVEEGPDAEATVDRLRGLARRRGALFLPVVLHCDLDVQVGRIANADRIALRKGADPEGYRRFTQEVPLHEPQGRCTSTRPARRRRSTRCDCSRPSGTGASAPDGSTSTPAAFAPSSHAVLTVLP